MRRIREPAVSGTFYPADPKILKQEIKGFLDDAVFDAIMGDIVGIVSPHAGYIYSGPVAAFGYKALMGKTYDTVIIIAPSHTAYFEGVSMLEAGGYRTPLGVVDIDEETAADILRADGIINTDMKPHVREHSLEVQLPFLQVVLNTFSLVPLIMGIQDLSTCERLAGCIWSAIQRSGKRCLVVASSDLSHYYPYAEAVKLDSVVVKNLEAFDVAGLAGDCGKNRCEACGFGPVIATMMVSKKMGATGSKVLKYANSGDTSGDKSGVVGYVSGAFFKPAHT